MTRIFTFFALLAVLFLSATTIIGLGLGDVSDRYAVQTQYWARIHRLSGIATSLSVLFVESIVVTYFIGTSRWCREVVEAYSLNREFAQRSARLKRKTFPVAVGSMLIVVGIVALGGAADPAAALRLQPVGGLRWSQLHLAGALAGTAAIVAGFYVEWHNIHANHLVINEVVAQVRAVRRERGLDVD